MTAQVFPVVGPFTNCGPYGPRGAGFHYGVDLCAPTNTPLLAVDDGTVHYANDPLGGNVIVLHASDGRAWYYAHLAGFEGTDRAVQAGDLLGYVGMTGNAAHVGIPHLHIELWPSGGFQRPAPDPTPELMAARRSSPNPPLPTPVPVPASTPASPWVTGGVILGASAAVALAVRSLRARVHASRRTRFV